MWSERIKQECISIFLRQVRTQKKNDKLKTESIASIGAEIENMKSKGK